MSVEDALRLAVNHDGDSDSTGAITGNLIGISLGASCIPKQMIEQDTELYSLLAMLEQYGRDLIQITELTTY